MPHYLLLHNSDIADYPLATLLTTLSASSHLFFIFSHLPLVLAYTQVSPEVERHLQTAAKLIDEHYKYVQLPVLNVNWRSAR